MKKTRFIFLLFLTLILSVLSVSNAADEESTEADLLVYIIGSDLETEQGAATQDICEMIHAMRAYPEKKILCYLCGSEKWWLPGLEDEHTYTLRIQSEGFEIIEDHGKTIGTTEEDLLAFLEHGKDGCDLILWGHGGSGIAGIGVNNVFGGDTLTLQEIQDALAERNARFRIIGFDACSMASLQTAWVTSPWCELFCGSLKDEDVAGWRYASVIPALMGGEPLNGTALQKTLRDPDITVINSKALYACGDALCRAFTGMPVGSGCNRLSDVWAVCPDREAGEQIATALGEADLLLSGVGPDAPAMEELLPEIGSAYQSFLNRK